MYKDYGNTDFLDPFQLEFIFQPEGYIEPSYAPAIEGTKPKLLGFKYTFQYTDHLGNIRLAYQDYNDDNAITPDEIKEEKHYYPFGLQMKGFNSTIIGANHPYGYNGKEENFELDLGFMDYHARQYDPALGKMMQIDPHADSYYGIAPYNYAINNPILLIDPDGKDTVITIQDNVITVSTQIYIYGSGATKEEAEKIQKSIMLKFGDFHEFEFTDENGKKYAVKFETEVDLYDEETTELKEGDNLIEVKDEEGRSNVNSLTGNTGTFYSKEQIVGENYGIYAHEFGHLLGLKDRYNFKWPWQGENTVDDEWKGNIMADSRLGDVDQRNIDGIVKGTAKKYNRLTKKYIDKKGSENPYKHIKKAYLNKVRGN